MRRLLESKSNTIKIVNKEKHFIVKEPILYIDDEKANLNSFRMALGKYYKIYLAQTVGEALDLLRNNKIKVILSDQRMPEMSGLDFIANAKGLYPDIICIILTAYSDTAVTLQAINQGQIYRFILKPWDKEELTLALNNALDKYHLQEENQNLVDALKAKNQELQAYTEELLATTSALRDSNEQLTIAKEKAEENDRLKSAFLANMSHEIRTPLNGILGFSEMLKMNDLSFEQVQKFINIIQKSSNQLLCVVNDVLDLSKIETGQLDVMSNNVNVNELLHTLHARFLPDTQTKMLQFDALVPARDLLLYTDEDKLMQIFTNLISNALKFTHHGKISFGCTIEQDQVLFFVQDSGIGIASENHNIIFESFRQVEITVARTYGGTGLGLTITKALVECLGGRIWIDSKLECGSTFYFILPNTISM